MSDSSKAVLKRRTFDPIGFKRENFAVLTGEGKEAFHRFICRALAIISHRVTEHLSEPIVVHFVPEMKHPVTGDSRFFWLDEIIDGLCAETLDASTMIGGITTLFTATDLRALPIPEGRTPPLPDVFAYSFARGIRHNFVPNDFEGEHSFPQHFVKQYFEQLLASEGRRKFYSLNFTICRFWTDGAHLSIFSEKDDPSFNRPLFGIIFPFDDEACYYVQTFVIVENNGKIELKVIEKEEFANLPAMN